MQWFKLLLIALMVGISAFGVVGCDAGDGPAEEAGESLDEAAEDVQEGAEDALEGIKDRADAINEE